MNKKKIIGGVIAPSILGAALFSFIPPQEKTLAQSIASGKELYAELCITCHGATGKGLPPGIPPLAGADYILKNPVNAIYAQKFGLSGPITVNGKKYDTPMPVPGISNEEIADISNYILNSWGNKGKMITEKQVEAVKKKGK